MYKKFFINIAFTRQQKEKTKKDFDFSKPFMLQNACSFYKASIIRRNSSDIWAAAMSA